MVGKMVAVAVAAAARYETGSFNFKCDDIVNNLKQVMVMWKIACVNVFWNDWTKWYSTTKIAGYGCVENCMCQRVLCITKGSSKTQILL
jgi:hypothetical protein